MAQETPTAVITGAGSGIGRATALALAAEGFRLLLVGRTESKLQRVHDELEGTGHLVHPADLSHLETLSAVAQQVQQTWGSLNALVNAAGVAPKRNIAQTDFALIRETFAINTEAPALLIAKLWDVLRASTSPVVVNISSLAAHDPFAGFYVYAASKAALESLTRSITAEDKNVRAYNVAPGAVETPMLRGLFDESQLPNSETLSPEDVASVILDCALGRRASEAGKTIPLPSG